LIVCRAGGHEEVTDGSWEAARALMTEVGPSLLYMAPSVEHHRKARPDSYTLFLI